MTNRFLAASVGLVVSLGCSSSTESAAATDTTNSSDTSGLDTRTSTGDVAAEPDVTAGTDGLDATAEDVLGSDSGANDGQDAIGVEDVGTDGMTDAVDIAAPGDTGGLDSGDGNDVGTPADVVVATDLGAPGDVGVSVDVGAPDDIAADTTVPSGAGETCAEAADLKQASEPTLGADYEHVVTGGFGASNDLNPFKDAGLAPACSIVYDAKGKEVVYAIDLNPGDILDMRYIVTPSDHPGGLYVLDSCDPTTWPDYDKSGMCGSNEYKSQGYCGVVGQCDPIDFNFLYPATYTEQKRFWIVLDEVAGDTAESFKLYWTVIPAK